MKEERIAEELYGDIITVLGDQPTAKLLADRLSELGYTRQPEHSQKKICPLNPELSVVKCDYDSNSRSCSACFNRPSQDKVEAVARQIHLIQIESAKLNDAYTEGIAVYYITWEELHEDMRQWYILKSREILSLLSPELPTLLEEAKREELERILSKLKNEWLEVNLAHSLEIIERGQFYSYYKSYSKDILQMVRQALQKEGE